MIDVATCRGCGCTDWRACPGGCAWVDDPEGRGDLCSTCLIAIWNGEPLPRDLARIPMIATETELERRAAWGDR